MTRQDYNYSIEVARIMMPVLLVFSDSDAVHTARALEYFELLGGGKRDGGRDGSGMSSGTTCSIAKRGTSHDSSIGFLSQSWIAFLIRRPHKYTPNESATWSRADYLMYVRLRYSLVGNMVTRTQRIMNATLI
jgi:hypothetical protein